MAKSAFASQTVLASLGVFAAGLTSLATNPTFYGKVAKCADTFEQAAVGNAFRTLGEGMVTILPFVAIAGRFKVGDLHTPKFLPGPNKDDLLAREEQQQQQATMLQGAISTLHDRTRDLEHSVQATTSSLISSVDSLHEKVGAAAIAPVPEARPRVLDENYVEAI